MTRRCRLRKTNQIASSKIISCASTNSCFNIVRRVTCVRVRDVVSRELLIGRKGPVTRFINVFTTRSAPAARGRTNRTPPPPPPPQQQHRRRYPIRNYNMPTCWSVPSSLVITLSSSLQ